MNRLAPNGSVLFSLWALVLTAALPVSAGDWSRFRGPNGAGVSSDRGVPVEFGEQENLIWKVAVGKGNSSPVAYGKQIFFQTASEDGSDRQLKCLSLTDGKELWSYRVPGHTATTHPKNSLASCTAAVDADRVVMPFWDGTELTVLAFTREGKPLWSRSLGPFKSQHGAGHSPILIEGKAIVVNDQDGLAEVFALDAQSGEVLWKTTRAPFRASYSTPLLVERPGEPTEVLVASTGGVSTYDLQSGSETWKWIWKSNTKQLRTVGSPILVGGVVVFSGGNGPGDRQVAAVKLNGRGDVSDTHLAWETHKLFPYVPCMLARGDHLYFVNDAGIAGCCIAKTGEMIWSKRLGEGTFFASPVMVEDRVYAFAENGNIFVFAAEPEFRSLATNHIDDEILASPAVTDGKLLIRGKSHLYCFGEH